MISANSQGDPYCFNLCSFYGDSPQITLTVDMTEVPLVSNDGVLVVGDFGPYEPDSFKPMTANGDEPEHLHCCTLWDLSFSVF